MECASKYTSYILYIHFSGVATIKTIEIQRSWTSQSIENARHAGRCTGQLNADCASRLFDRYTKNGYIL
jgi:hypothetical protein